MDGKKRAKKNFLRKKYSLRKKERKKGRKREKRKRKMRKKEEKDEKKRRERGSETFMLSHSLISIT